MFLGPLGKSKEYIEKEVNNGRFPPCIIYHVIYSLEGNRVKPALMKVHVHGADVPLVFGCRIKEQLCEYVCMCACVCTMHVWMVYAVLCVYNNYSTVSC